MSGKNSSEHQKWVEYCEHRTTQDDNILRIIYNDYGESKIIIYHIVGFANIRGDNSFILFNNSEGILEWIPEQYLVPELKQNVQSLSKLKSNGILNSTPMCSIGEYFARMEFSWISKYMKDILEDSWDDLDMDEMIRESKYVLS